MVLAPAQPRAGFSGRHLPEHCLPHLAAPPRLSRPQPTVPAGISFGSRRRTGRAQALDGLASDHFANDRGTRQSVDPGAQKVEDEGPCVPGSVSHVHSAEQFAKIQDNNKSRLVVLMCKASHCRPCKMFGRKYSRMAERFSDSILLDISGDETNDTKKMMISMEVRVTPTFRLYRDSQCIGVVTGTHESKLGRAIREQLAEHEAGGNYCNLDERVEEVPVA